MLPCPYNEWFANVSKYLSVQYSKRNTEAKLFYGILI